MEVKFTLTGEVPSHKNLWKRARWGGLYMSNPEAFNSLVEQFNKQKLQYSQLPLLSPLMLNLRLWGDDRKDLNNQIATICDVLEKSGIIKNDRQIKEIHASKLVTKKELARAEIDLSEM